MDDNTKDGLLFVAVMIIILIIPAIVEYFIHKPNKNNNK